MPSSIPWLPAPGRALVVGINQYDSPHITPLRGCVRDAAAVTRFLREQLGMAEANICLLVSHEAGGEGAELAPLLAGARRATRANLIAGIRDFLGGTPAGEEALFYYSGHGSTTALAPEISFGTGKGETLVPADARVGGVLDLVDRELRYLVAELADKGVRLTLIADSCHAAGVLRGEGNKPLPVEQPVPRLAWAERTTRTLASLLDGTVDKARLERLYQAQTVPYTLVAGALPTQQSFEMRQDDGEIGGAMTTALLQVLTSANGPMSYRDLGRSVRAALLKQRSQVEQHPYVASDQDRLLFGATPLVRPLPVFVVREIAGSQIVLEGGQIQGVYEGSELTCFADWSFGTEQGRWRVVSAAPDSARADPVDGAPMPKVGQPLRLDKMGGLPTLWFHPEARPVAEQWRERTLKGPPFLVEVFSPEADYTVGVEQVGADKWWSVRRRDGTEVTALRQRQSNRGHYDVANHLDRVACYEHFVSQAPAASTALSVAFGPGANSVALVAELLDWQGTATPLVAGGAVAPLPRRARVRLTLQNNAGKPLYAHVYRLDPLKHVAQRIWPADGTDQLLPGDSAASVWESTTWEGGTLPLKIIVSATPLDMELWPCGHEGNFRGPSLGGVRVIGSEWQGWATSLVTVGRPGS